MMTGNRMDALEAARIMRLSALMDLCAENDAGFELLCECATTCCCSFSYTHHEDDELKCVMELKRRDVFRLSQRM